MLVALLATSAIVVEMVVVEAAMAEAAQYNFPLISSIVSRPGVLGDLGDLGVLGA